MNLRLHHNTESGSTPALAVKSRVTEKSPPELLPANFPPPERPFDITTDLQYNQCRWYDPTPGQWVSEEPNGFDASDENLTRYVGQ